MGILEILCTLEKPRGGKLNKQEPKLEPRTVLGRRSRRGFHSSSCAAEKTSCKQTEIWSSHCGSAVTNLTSIYEDMGLIPGPLHGLRIRRGYELWLRHLQREQDP